jgi:type IV pilus assembly protein PilX
MKRVHECHRTSGVANRTLVPASRASGPQGNQRALHPQAGAALAIGLILLLVLTLLAVSGMTTASQELWMSGNDQYHEHAFQAAEAGVEQALRNGGDGTAIVGRYDETDPLDPAPVRGSGRAVRDCPEPPSAQAAERCEYFVRIERNGGVTPIPDGYSLGSELEAHHFVIDSFGASSRGAVATHQQGYYVVGPGGT